MDVDLCTHNMHDMYYYTFTLHDLQLNLLENEELVKKEGVANWSKDRRFPVKYI